MARRRITNIDGTEEMHDARDAITKPPDEVVAEKPPSDREEGEEPTSGGFARNVQRPPLSLPGMLGTAPLVAERGTLSAPPQPKEPDPFSLGGPRVRRAGPVSEGLVGGGLGGPQGARQPDALTLQALLGLLGILPGR